MPISDIYVPDTGPANSRILFVGEAPGANEEEQKLPFVGESGNILITCLGRAGISRDEVRLTNICHYRPLPNNKFELLLGSSRLKEGLVELENYINQYKPTVIVALGKYPLATLTGKNGISRFRGSILPCIFDETIKVIPTFHPAHVLRNREDYPIFDLDIRKAIADSKFPEFNYPKYDMILDPQPIEAELLTQELCAAPKLATDIETVKKTKKILCVGFAPSATRVVVFPFEKNQVNIARILESQSKKIFQFGTFDVMQLHENGIRTNNYWWDTLTAQHALNPELPRGLDFLASIYTRQPYYKHEGRSEIPNDNKAWGSKVDKHLLYEYNGKDCCCTYAIQEGQEEDLSFDSYARGVFDFEMEEIEMAIAISLQGLPIDVLRMQELKDVLLKKWAKKQYILNYLARRPDVNVRSPALKKLLYDDIGLPVKKKRDGKGNTVITTDEDALIALITFCGSHLESLRSDKARLDWQVKQTICKLILEIRGIRQLLSVYLNKEVDANGRLRSTFKVSNTETGRWACEKFVDGSGINAQTMPREAIEIPDDLVSAPEVSVDTLKIDEDTEDSETESESELVGV